MSPNPVRVSQPVIRIRGGSQEVVVPQKYKSSSAYSSDKMQKITNFGESRPLSTFRLTNNGHNTAKIKFHDETATTNKKFRSLEGGRDTKLDDNEVTSGKPNENDVVDFSRQATMISNDVNLNAVVERDLIDIDSGTTTIMLA